MAGILSLFAASTKVGIWEVDCRTENCEWTWKCTNGVSNNFDLVEFEIVSFSIGTSSLINNSDAFFKLTCLMPRDLTGDLKLFWTDS